MESATVQEGPYIVHARERGRGDKEERCLNSTHLYLRDERLYEDERSRIGFMDVDERMEAMFVLSVYYPIQVQPD